MMATLGLDMFAAGAVWVAGAGAEEAGVDLGAGLASSAWLFLSLFPGKHIHEDAGLMRDRWWRGYTKLYTSIERLAAQLCRETFAPRLGRFVFSGLLKISNP